MMRRSINRPTLVMLAMLLSLSLPKDSSAQDYPPLEKVTEGFELIPSPEGETPFYKLWINKKTNQMLAALPKDFARQKHFIAVTVSSGQVMAGLQGSDFYVYWRPIGRRVALIQKNTETRSEGDAESKRSVSRLFTDQVLVDLPILTMDGPSPVIDLDDLLVSESNKFFGPVDRINPRLVAFTRTKAFPNNIEVAFEAPNMEGKLQTLHYSISLVPDRTDPNYRYKARMADERVGYFTTVYDDFGKYDSDKTRVRYINRWHLEKKSPELKVSPPKKAIVFYIENTTPVRYRKWIRKGVDYWNKAFEEVGFDQAIIVHDQDSNPLYQSYDAEDVRYNFIRWLNNDIATAIGPSRVHPETGEILDADIILTDGWIRAFQTQFQKQMPKIAMDGMSPETLAWLAENPEWDPRVRLAAPAVRDIVKRQILAAATSLTPDMGGTSLQTALIGDEPFDGLLGRTSQINGYCAAADGRSLDIAFMKMALAMQEPQPKPNGEPTADQPQMLDGMPEEFIGPLLADLVCHEVGHTLGLRHNFKASSIYDLSQINSDEIKDKKPFSGSIMDYNPTNFRLISGNLQGNYGMTDIGPYDKWAIQYGYADDKQVPEILKRVAEPELVYATDEDTMGPDPLARRYDFAKNPLDFAKEQMALAKHHRDRILTDYVKDGDSWAKSREGYILTLQMQLKATSMMANWIGGAHVNRDRKGDPNGRVPLQPVPAEQQRAALAFVIENTFRDEAYGLTPDLLTKMTVDKWLDLGMDMMGTAGEPTWPLHDQIMGLQATTMTQILNPTTLRRVYDNEARVSAEEAYFTLPELLKSISAAVWTELGGGVDGVYNERKPAISSLRRNLQAEHVNRLIGLSREHSSPMAAMRPISTLARQELRELVAKIDGYLQAGDGKLDVYTKAHLNDLQQRVTKFLDAQHVVN
ncbi:MAG: zinc-dependent metalloprotease [Planctomycetaceae bacterium]|nr:zinc-dependent metalloprotease [Planctomycetaceae bacterium]